jgi:hypothetical protein
MNDNDCALYELTAYGRTLFEEHLANCHSASGLSADRRDKTLK